MKFTDANGGSVAFPATMYMLCINRNYMLGGNPCWVPIAAFTLQSDAQLYLNNCGTNPASLMVLPGSIGWDPLNLVPCFVLNGVSYPMTAPTPPEYAFIRTTHGDIYGVTPDLATGQCYVKIPNPRDFPLALVTGHVTL